MNNFTKIITVNIVVVLVGAALLFSAMSDQPEPAPVQVPEEYSNAPVERESEWRQSFIEGCVPAGNTESECNCLYDWLRARYTIGEIADLGVNIDSEESQRVLTHATTACFENE